MKYAFPVIIGIIATCIAGLILWPAVYIVFDTFFELYIFSTPPKGAWINDAIIITTIILWLLVASMTGGFTSARLTSEKEDFVIFLLIISSFIIGYLIFPKFFLSIEVLPVIAAFVTGYVSGGWLGVRYKKKKLKQNQT